MFKNKKAKETKPVERKKEHYIPSITRENKEEAKPAEKKSTVSDGFKETVGYHRSPSYYDTIRGKKAPQKEEVEPVNEEVVEETVEVEVIPEYTEFDLDEEIKAVEDQQEENDYTEIYEEITYEEEKENVKEDEEPEVETVEKVTPVTTRPVSNLFLKRKK